jgi:ABC-type Fe3+/spermidine/putrescine transport system ATPase subunit
MTIRFQGVSKSYAATRVVKDLDLEVTDGELFTLLGASGSGKTTILRLVAGLERPDSGRLVFDDKPVSDADAGLFVPPEQRGLGMVFQSYALWPHLTVRGNLALGLEERHMRRAEVAAKVAAMLAQVGLAGLEHRYPHELSGGQQQRVALARALIAEPRILLLDEPLSNLDAVLREQVRGEIRSLQRRLRITTILVTHDQAEAMSVSDRIGIVHDGRILQVDRPEVLYHRPRSAFAATFLGRANLLRGEATGGAVCIGTARLELAVPIADGPATLMVRPEWLMFDQGPNQFEATIRQAVLSGNLTRYEVEVPALGAVLQIDEISAQPPRQGAISIVLPPDRIVPLPG